MSTIVPINDDKQYSGEESPLPHVPKGTRLEIWWPDDQRYYTGFVVAIKDPSNSNTKTKRKQELWKIRYDDNEVEWVDLRTERYRILSHQDDDEDGDGDVENYSRKNDTTGVQIGSLVSVWWEYYNQYFPGVVKRIRTNRTKPWFVQYDDGDARWEDLSRTKFFLRSSTAEDNDDSSLVYNIGVPKEV